MRWWWVARVFAALMLPFLLYGLVSTLVEAALPMWGWVVFVVTLAVAVVGGRWFSRRMAEELRRPDPEMPPPSMPPPDATERRDT